MLIDTIRFSHLLESQHLHDISHFLAHTTFIISHKTESLDTLAGVLWYLPVCSPIIVVTNCPEQNYPDLLAGMRARLTPDRRLYLVHQKDAELALLLRAQGVEQILGSDGRVRDGKGEGMYLGTLLAELLHFPQWVVFYDADNLVPCALLEYTLAMGRLFLAAHSTYAYHEEGRLHNIRICWASKPRLHADSPEPVEAGRCSRVISPLFTLLLRDWFGQSEQIHSSNAGEQGMTLATARALRFSSGFSIETFQLLELLFRATPMHSCSRPVLLQQYRSQSPHFHTKRDDQHIRQMIAASLGCFLVFQEHLPPLVADHILRLCSDLALSIAPPLLYPPLQELDLAGYDDLPLLYQLFADRDSPNRDSDTLLETTRS
jgi:mannosyl-3-phosphoglycerate synthase